MQCEGLGLTSRLK